MNWLGVKKSTNICKSHIQQRAYTQNIFLKLSSYSTKKTIHPIKKWTKVLNRRFTWEDMLPAFLIMFVLHFVALSRNCIFYKLTICGNPALSLLVPLFPPAFAHFMALHHIFCNSLNVSNFFIIVFVMVICDQWSLMLLSWGATNCAQDSKFNP